MFRRALTRRVAIVGTAIPVAGYAYWRWSQPPKPIMDDNRPPPLWTPPSRKQMLDGLKAAGRDGEELDLLIIGGGATGAGVAVDAASRGLKVGMVERDDFSSGTSSKSTKLVHGGVRYLQKAVMELDYEQYKLVKEALRERRVFLSTAPYLSNMLPIMLPLYQWWQLPYYYAGCKMYDFLAGGENMASSYIMLKERALEAFPMLKPDNLVGAIVYYDGQHNDSRMNMALVMTAVHYGAMVANHTEVVKVNKTVSPDGSEPKVTGARIRDNMTGEEWDVKAKGVINATGPFADGVRQLDDPTVKPIVAPSGGVHVTLPNYYSPRTMGMLDPHTSDGRVIFFLPWQGNTIAGTTDSPVPVEHEPKPKEEEIEWILDEVRRYLSPDIQVRRGDVLSAWAGIRPLVRDPAAKNTESLVRNHMINVSPSGLLTVAGGKWTTYREMAEETVDTAVKAFDLKPASPCKTQAVRLVGGHGWTDTMFIRLIQQYGLETEVAQHLASTYGDRAWTVCSLAEPTGLHWPLHGHRICDLYPYIDAEILYGVRYEYALTAVDFIARRTRLSFLNAQAALDSLPTVISVMGDELGWGVKRRRQEWIAARNFLDSMGLSESEASRTPPPLIGGPTWLQHITKLFPWSSTGSTSGGKYSRATFSAEELDRLKKVYDTREDKIKPLEKEDLHKVLEAMGFKDIQPATMETLVPELTIRKGRALQWEDFLDACANLKELSFREGTPSHLASEQRKNIPVEKSGGGV
ncbi:DAO-domain-containing protein [Dacryopinax primogenitus]|uniref:Glycerol-3-phosphate dehydrogenase n=1 Tax=Dacryopinax primogenitus (strain DJM 731) TaxID=1858805 RepID=M5FZA2_DACPD|nr:DAO-domain-containing protein [Dacryopinax primogenitus]EJU03376.1 DAO-domain-containing protein [Dacryopinax primogenitus]